MDWQGEVLSSALGRYPALEEQELRRVIHQFCRTRHKAQYCELFRILKAAHEQHERQQRLTQETGSL